MTAKPCPPVAPTTRMTFCAVLAGMVEQIRLSRDMWGLYEPTSSFIRKSHLTGHTSSTLDRKFAEVGDRALVYTQGRLDTTPMRLWDTMSASSALGAYAMRPYCEYRLG